MTSFTKLGLQGFAFGVALTSGGCMPQNQDQIDQLRADLTALKTEVASLKTAPGSSPGATPSIAPGSDTPATATGSVAGDSTAAAAQASAVDWEAALEKHDKEERDAAWSRLREPDLFTAAKAHIKLYGASLNGVRCKTTSCLITVNVPKKPKTEYAVMPNPWAGTEMVAHSKAIYSGRTLWSYLLTRHEKDTKEAGAERVDPAELAEKNPELVHAAVVVGASPSVESNAESKPASGSQPATAKSDAAKPSESSKPVATAAKTPAPEAAKATSTKPAAGSSKPTAVAPQTAAAAPQTAAVAPQTGAQSGAKPAGETAISQAEPKPADTKSAPRAAAKPQAASAEPAGNPPEAKPAAAPTSAAKPAPAGPAK